MRYFALATDYDGTLAGPDALRTIERIKASGRRVVLVTGRILQDLLEVFPGAAVCDRIVAENGAVIHNPATRETRAIGAPPPAEFMSRLGRRGVAVAVGRVIAATRVPNEVAVLETIQELGLELQIVFNRGAVMILPASPAIVSMLGVALEHRPAFFERLLHAILDLRARVGRPHWIVVDEAHHVLRKPLPPLQGMLYITVHVERVTEEIDLEISTTGETGVYRAGGRLFSGIVPRDERRRHHREYSQGELCPDKNFYFRGPDGKLQLRAQNLQVFLQMADGVDDATWTHHLENGDIAAWFREAIKDEDLAGEAERVAGLPPAESRSRIRAKIEEQYTAAE